MYLAKYYKLKYFGEQLLILAGDISPKFTDVFNLIKQSQAVDIIHIDSKFLNFDDAPNSFRILIEQLYSYILKGEMHD